MKIQSNELQRQAAPAVPQVQVRTDVRSGGDLEVCQFNLEKWKDRYYYWYEQARKAGKL